MISMRAGQNLPADPPSLKHPSGFGKYFSKNWPLRKTVKCSLCVYPLMRCYYRLGNLKIPASLIPYNKPEQLTDERVEGILTRFRLRYPALRHCTSFIQLNISEGAVGQKHPKKETALLKDIKLKGIFS